MKLKTRLLLLAGSLGLAAVLSSCESTGTGDTTAGSEAVMCDKCKTLARLVNSERPYTAIRRR
jgi:hypothetical protein